jgi:hypothetical protein
MAFWLRDNASPRVEAVFEMAVPVIYAEPVLPEMFRVIVEAVVRALERVFQRARGDHP